MVSQHPDNASKPYWHSESFVSDQHEVKECFMSFSKLGVSEYKWDWEGKFVEESVFERLIGEYSTFFRKNPLGKEKFLTFRLPDFRVETEFRLGRAFMCILSANGLAKHLNFHTPAIFEVILPMTKSAHEMIDVHKAYEEVASLKNKLIIKNRSDINKIDIIPLFEDIRTIINSAHVLEEYIDLYSKYFGSTISYIRPYLARSDPALNSGLIPSVLSVKIALSSYKDLENITNVMLYPIIGTGSLPFRGGSTPYSVEKFVREYSGVRTMLVQSGFQYDFPIEDVIKAIKQIDKILPLTSASILSTKEVNQIVEVIPYFEDFYQITVKKIGKMIYQIAKFLPARRERLKHTGILKYPRKIGKVKIPRAIGFTAALYSIGMPPEFIGTGRGIKRAIKEGTISIIEKYYLGLKDDLNRAGGYLNKDVLRKLARESSVFEDIAQDIIAIEHYLGHDLGPQSVEEKAHEVITSEIYSNFISGISITDFIEEAGILRRSLG